MNNAKWYLLKHSDGEHFGPVSLEQIRQWAADAAISPLDKISCDNQNWVKAPMLPELEMDYLLETGQDTYYGPTTAGAVKEFLAAAEITLNTPVTNCKTGDTRPLKDFPQLVPAPVHEHPEPRQAVRKQSVREHLQNRIRQLEQALMEERRQRASAEERLARAEARLVEAGISPLL